MGTTASSFLVKIRNIDTDFQKAGIFFGGGGGFGWFGLVWFGLCRFGSVGLRGVCGRVGRSVLNSSVS